MRLCCWNVGGWSLKDSENKHFREQTLINSKCDIFCVVETFLKNKETLCVDGYTYFTHNRVSIHKKAKRGSGGVGVFIRNELLNLFSVLVLDDSIEDVLWIKLSNVAKVQSDNIVLCVAYLPPAGSVRNNDPEAFYCSLLEQVHAYQNEGRLFVCGDVNSRVGDDSDYIEGVDDVRPRDILDFTANANGDLLIDFLVDCGLCMVNGRLGVNNFTHVSHRGKSVVDYVFVPYEQLVNVQFFEVCLMSELVNELQMQGNSKIPDHSLLLWSVPLSSSGSIVNDGTSSLNEQTSRTVYNTSTMPTTFLNGADAVEVINDTIKKIEHNLHQEQDVNSAYNTFTSLLWSEMEQTLPKKRPPSTSHAKSMYKPYWSEDLQNAWDVVCGTERLWLRCRGSQTEKRRLRDAFNRKRKLFDKLNRCAKRKYQLSEQERLKDLYSDHDTRNFWKYIGKIGLHNERKSSIPMEVVDRSGNVSTDTSDILSRWKSDYENLFCDNTNNFDENHLSYIQTALQNNSVARVDADLTILNSAISKSEVEKSIFRAKLRKASGLDNIPAEVLRNPVCVDLLHEIISYCFNTGTVPRDWNTGVIKPIPKADGRDPRDPLSYRGITLISVPCKIYADILNLRLSKWIEDNYCLVEEQNGFRRNRSCMEHIYTLYTVINKRKLSKLPTYACFVDAKKAFDTVNRDCLWYKLTALGINGKIFEAIHSLYDNVKCAVNVNGHMTSYLDVALGVKQGCRLSPTLFALYINDLAEDIKALGCGIELDVGQLSLLLYADDVVLIAPTEDSLQLMLNTLNDWCSKWRLLINTDKTKIIHFRPVSKEKCQFDFRCGDIAIEITDTYKYLGLWFHEHLDMKFAVNELAKSASRALSALYTKFLHVGGMDYNVFCKLYESLVEPVLFYGAGIWGLSEQKKINTVQNKACRYFLGLGKNAANIASQGDMGWTSCIMKQRIEASRLFFKVEGTSEDRLVKRVFMWSGSHGKSWESRFKSFMNNIGLIGVLNRDNCPLKNKVKCVKDKLKSVDIENWKNKLWNDSGQENGNKLRTYRIYKSDLKVEHYVNINMDRSHRRILAKFRSGSLPLNIETGRYAKPKVPLMERTCKLCSENVVEDEMHFLLACDFYSDLRRALLLKAQNCNIDFQNLSVQDKFIFIMNYVNMQHILSSTLIQMFNRRKRFQ